MIKSNPFLFFCLIMIGITTSACGGLTAEAFEGTPIPSLIPATLPAEKPQASVGEAQCRIRAVDLIGAWVDAGTPDADPFDFASLDNQPCTATFQEDVLRLFIEPNLWFSGAPACVTCHNANIETASAGLDLSSYDGILAGSRRGSQGDTGNDVLGGGDWIESIMYQQLINRQMPIGRPPDSPAKGPVVAGGSPQE